MTSSAISFLAWAVFMVVLLSALGFSAYRSRKVDRQTEDTASKALPEIGGIAEKKYRARYGRAPTNVPEDSAKWYPEEKRRFHRLRPV